MTIGRIFLLASLLSTNCLAGLSKIDFMYYRAKYKNAYGLTRHKQFSIHTMDDNASRYWIGSLFMGTASGKGFATTLSDGKELFGLVTKGEDLRAMWVQQPNFYTRPNYSTLNAVNRNDPSHPNLHDVKNVAVCADGSIAIQSGTDWTLVSGKLSLSSAYLESWTGSTSNSAFVGVAMHCSPLRSARPITLTRTGLLEIWTHDLTESIDLQIDVPVGISFLSLKGDGLPDAEGLLDLWAQTVTIVDGKKVFGLSNIVVNVNTNELLGYRNFPLKIHDDAEVALAFGAMSNWVDFVPFYVGENDIRIIAIAKDRVHVFSRAGQWIDSPWGTPRPSLNLDNYSKWKPSGPIYQASAIMTPNTKANWKTKYELLVADDFGVGSGHGIHKLQWSPDGFSDYLALEVKLKDIAHSGEKMNKPVIQVTNNSASRQLYDAKIRLWLSREEIYPEQLVADKYWMSEEGSTVEVGCSEDNPNYCWVDIVLGEEFTLDPGQSTAFDGIQIGVHGARWNNQWNRGNDFTWSGVTQSPMSNSNVTVYSRLVAGGEWIKVWGNVPSIESVPLPFGWIKGPPVVDDSRNLVLGFEGGGSWNTNEGAALSFDYERKIQGRSSLRVSSAQWILLESKQVVFQGNESGFKFKVYSQDPVGNPWWKGEIQLFLDAPSKNLFNQWVGQVSISEIPENSWREVDLPFPGWIARSISGGGNDLRLRLTVNRPVGSGPVYFDEGNLTISP